MPRSVVDVDTVCLFEARLDKFWMHQDVIYDFGASAELSARHFGTGAELSGHFGTNLMMLKCLSSEVSWVRSVLTPLNVCTIWT